MRTHHCVWLAALAAAVTGFSPLAAQQIVQERVDLGVVERIRDEGLNRSQIERIARTMTDVHGPRLTNSPANRRANAWAAETLKGWGLANATVELWDQPFARGWERLQVSARVLEPTPSLLIADVQAWSGSTRGPVACPVVVLEVSDTTDLARYAGTLRGSCVLRSAPGSAEPELDAAPGRQTLEALINPPVRPQGAGPGPGAGGPGRFQQLQALNAAVGRFLRAEQPAAILLPSGWSYNILRTGGHPDGQLARDSVYNPVPALLVSKEQYARLWRTVTEGTPARLEVNVQTRFHDGERRGENVVAELPGTDRADEVVMLGAHFDSWHSGTGATDNAAGSAVMMEAVRILKTLNLPLRRTVRIGLWSGEEQGLVGSRAWVRMHAAELPKISAYVNLDNGTGKIRGIWNQSNAAASPIFEQILFPFRDLGVVTVRNGNTGGTDHLAFDAVGVPGFNFIQDPIEYSTRTHHSNVDVFDHLLIDDLKQAATVVAWTVYHLANREEMMPRKVVPTP